LLEEAEHEEVEKELKDTERHRQYMYGSEDVAHHEAYYKADGQDEHHEDVDMGKFMHGSEDVAHQWHYMLQALETEERHRQQDVRAAKIEHLDQ